MSNENPLTHREIECLECLAEGKSVAEIAKQFRFSQSTVKTHVSRANRKLGTRNKTHAVVYALQNEYIKQFHEID